MKYNKKNKPTDQELNQLLIAQMQSANLLKGEKIEQMTDQKSFKGRYYYPAYAVTNKGRVWSIINHKWLAPQAVGTDRSYWAVDLLGTMVKVHLLVANYFCDKYAVEVFGEANVQVHHKKVVDVPEELKTKECTEEKIKSCMDANAAENLCYQKTDDHLMITKFSNHQNVPEESKGKVELDEQLKRIRMLFDPRSSEIMLDYDQKGNAALRIVIHFNRPAPTLEP